MPRPPKPWWDHRRQCYYTQAGGRQRRLDREDGSPVPRGDAAGVAAALASILGERPTTGRAGPLDVASVCQRWLDWSRSAGRRERTVAGHRAILQRICDHRHRGKRLGTLPADALGLVHWSGYQRALLARGLSSRTVAAHFASLRACWRWAARPVVGRSPQRILRHDPLRDACLDLPRGRRRVRGALPPGAVPRIVGAAEAAGPEWFALAVKVQAESGCRTSEVVGLRWEWWRGRWWEIPPDQHKTGGKTGKPRVVAVTAATAARVESLRAGQSEGWCFKSSSDQFAALPPSRNRYASRFAKVAASVGLPDARPYCLRDHFADAARRAGVAPHVAARVQGHSAEVSVAHYQTLAGEEAVGVVERVAGGG